MNELIAEIGNAAQIIATPNCADIATIIISLSALVASIIVACKQAKISKKQAEISEQQNKISLFEHRYKIYTYILECNNFARQICKTANENEDILEIYKMMHRGRNLAVEIGQLNRHTIISDMLSLVGELEKVDFLFPNDVSEYALSLYKNLLATIMCCLVSGQDYIEECKVDLEKILADFEKNKIYDKMVAKLQLDSGTNQFRN